MGVPAAAAAGPVTSTSGATRILLLVNCVSREELLEDECGPSRAQAVAAASVRFCSTF